MEERLCTELLKLKDKELYPFHMPGHKRNINKLSDYIKDSGQAADNSEMSDFGSMLSGAYGIDITEIDGFDNLHAAEGLIKKAQEAAAKLYKSDETYFLVNGSTSGILAAISAVTERGDKIIVARNCHISVYNAIELKGLEPIFVYPDTVAENYIKSGINGPVKPSDIEKAIINNPDAKAVIITSPTYDGVISDAAAIAKTAHEFDIPLIVDEAHGALFFMEGRSAVINGADIVINSVHKTLPALTQTALMHVNGSLVSGANIRKYLRIFQSSSPSYVLMGSIDYAVYIMENYGLRLYRDFCIRTKKLKDALNTLRYFKYVGADRLSEYGINDFDESKVLISAGTSGLTGKELYDILREKYFLQPEMAAGDYVLLMTTLFDSDEGIERLINALYEADRSYTAEDICSLENKDTPGQALIEELERLKECLGKPSGKTVFIYPPGIPVLVKGEMVTDEILESTEKAVNTGLDVKFAD